MDSHHIRVLQPDDVTSYVALRLKALREDPTSFLSTPEEDAAIPLSEQNERVTESEDRFIVGAFHDDALIGLAGLRREQRQPLAHSAVIWGVFVAAPFRRQGLGYRIIAHALEHANGMRGLCRVRLGVNATNVAAIKLYESPGFTPYGLERGYMLIDGVLHDEMYMDRQMRFTPSLHP